MRIEGECNSLVIRLSREFDGKYTVVVELQGEESKVIETIPVTEHRNLTSAVESIVTAAHAAEGAVHRSKLTLVR